MIGGVDTDIEFGLTARKDDFGERALGEVSAVLGGRLGGVNGAGVGGEGVLSAAEGGEEAVMAVAEEVGRGAVDVGAERAVIVVVAIVAGVRVLRVIFGGR